MQRLSGMRCAERPWIFACFSWWKYDNSDVCGLGANCDKSSIACFNSSRWNFNLQNSFVEGGERILTDSWRWGPIIHNSVLCNTQESHVRPGQFNGVSEENVYKGFRLDFDFGAVYCQQGCVREMNYETQISSALWVMSFLGTNVDITQEAFCVIPTRSRGNVQRTCYVNEVQWFGKMDMLSRQNFAEYHPK